jgi:hypothetical protein
VTVTYRHVLDLTKGVVTPAPKLGATVDGAGKIIADGNARKRTSV